MLVYLDATIIDLFLDGKILPDLFTETLQAEGVTFCYSVLHLLSAKEKAKDSPMAIPDHYLATRQLLKNINPIGFLSVSAAGKLYTNCMAQEAGDTDILKELIRGWKIETALNEIKISERKKYRQLHGINLRTLNAKQSVKGAVRYLTNCYHQHGYTEDFSFKLSQIIKQADRHSLVGIAETLLQTWRLLSFVGYKVKNHQREPREPLDFADTILHAAFATRADILISTNIYKAAYLNAVYNLSGFSTKVIVVDGQKPSFKNHRN